MPQSKLCCALMIGMKVTYCFLFDFFLVEDHLQLWMFLSRGPGWAAVPSASSPHSPNVVVVIGRPAEHQ